MFFVFGPAGQVVSGAGDRLSQVRGVGRVRRPLALASRRIDSAVQPASPYAQEQGGAAATMARAEAAPTPSPQRAASAAAAYARTERGVAPARQPLTRVADVMTRGAITVAPDASLHAAWLQLAEHHLGQAPVVNAQSQVIGLLLRAHLMAPELLPAPQTSDGALLALMARTVAEVMVSPTPTVSASEDLRQVAGVLLAVGLPGLPVTDERGQVVGFLSRTDILRAVAADPPLDLWG